MRGCVWGGVGVCVCVCMSLLTLRRICTQVAVVTIQSFCHGSLKACALSLLVPHQLLRPFCEEFKSVWPKQKVALTKQSCSIIFHSAMLLSVSTSHRLLTWITHSILKLNYICHWLRALSAPPFMLCKRKNEPCPSWDCTVH